jgi:hypothetical protein
MKKERKDNILIFNRITDTALATIILGIAMVVFGLSMIAGSIISLSLGYRLIDSTSSLLLFALLHGIGFVADGIMLAAFCILVATTNPLSSRMQVLRIAGIVLTVYNAINLIAGIFLGTNGMGFVVSAACLLISSMLVLLTNKLITKAQSLVSSKAPAAVYNLKKAG